MQPKLLQHTIVVGQSSACSSAFQGGERWHWEVRALKRTAFRNFRERAILTGVSNQPNCLFRGFTSLDEGLNFLGPEIQDRSKELSTRLPKVEGSTGDCIAALDSFVITNATNPIARDLQRLLRNEPSGRMAPTKKQIRVHIAVFLKLH
jgi:hypothetical protein